MPKGSILVVDDEAEIREGLELLLSSEGYAVTSAETAAAGLTRLEERPVDLVLLDVSLPDRNGLELLQEIHRRDPLLAIVLITAYGSIEMARAAFKNGAQDYITKPWSNDELLAQVAQAVEGRQAALQLPQHYRQKRKNAFAAGRGHSGRGVALDRADLGRKRHGEGTDRKSHSFRIAARR
jgi:DNA-binding NtrC family response regulator